MLSRTANRASASGAGPRATGSSKLAPSACPCGDVSILRSVVTDAMFRWLPPLGNFAVAWRVIAVTSTRVEDDVLRAVRCVTGSLFTLRLVQSITPSLRRACRAEHSCGESQEKGSRLSVTRVEDRSEAKCQRLKRSSVPRWRGPRRRGCKSPLVLATTVVCSIRLVPVVTTGCWKS